MALSDGKGSRKIKADAERNRQCLGTAPLSADEKRALCALLYRLSLDEMLQVIVEVRERQRIQS